MSLAKGHIHPTVWEVEQCLTYTLTSFYFSEDKKSLIPYITDYIETEVYDIAENSDWDIDLIDFEWTLEKCEPTPRMVNSWDLAGNVKVKAFVKADRRADAISDLQRTIKRTFDPCSGDLIIRWNSWLEDVAEGAAA